VDYHRRVREALAALLESEGEAVCTQAGDRREALESATGEPPDVAMIDLSLDEDDGLDVMADLRALGIPVIVCSVHEEPEHVRRALAAGARAYVTKREAGQGLAQAIREVLDGWVLISPRAADDLAGGG
jgi:DNA-binding NarL/FixJ family response regulator